MKLKYVCFNFSWKMCFKDTNLEEKKKTWKSNSIYIFSHYIHSNFSKNTQSKIYVICSFRCFHFSHSGFSIWLSFRGNPLGLYTSNILSHWELSMIIFPGNLLRLYTSNIQFIFYHCEFSRWLSFREIC